MFSTTIHGLLAILLLLAASAAAAALPNAANQSGFYQCQCVPAPPFSIGWVLTRARRSTQADCPDEGLSSIQVVAIVLGVAAAMVGVAALCWWYHHRKEKKAEEREYDFAQVEDSEACVHSAPCNESAPLNASE